jgi:hypothetical protein
MCGYPKIGSVFGLCLAANICRALSGAVHPAYHDIPLFLHCLTDQVTENAGSSFEIKIAMKL